MIGYDQWSGHLVEMRDSVFKCDKGCKIKEFMFVFHRLCESGVWSWFLSMFSLSMADHVIHFCIRVS